MLKVLVADEDLKENSNCCRFLANDENLDIISASSGISTLNKYYETRPDILIINSDFMAKVYKLFFSPLSYKKLQKGIEEYNLDNIIFYEPNDENLSCLFYKFKIFDEGLGAKYLKYAIKKCYDDPSLLGSLNGIFEIVSKEYGVSFDSIRPAMRHALIPVNRFKSSHSPKGVFKLFEDEDAITPKNFIKNITIHYIEHKKRN